MKNPNTTKHKHPMSKEQEALLFGGKIEGGIASINIILTYLIDAIDYDETKLASMKELKQMHKKTEKWLDNPAAFWK